MTEKKKENCIHYEVCSSLLVGEVLGCISPEECKFYHTSASSDELDKAKAKLDGYYKSLPRGHPYLDGIDMSIQKIEELQKELRSQKTEEHKGKHFEMVQEP